MSDSEKLDKVLSTALWSIHRLPNKQQKEFAWNELIDILGDSHVYSKFIKGELFQIKGGIK